jgi:hypothetical protein
MKYLFRIDKDLDSGRRYLLLEMTLVFGGQVAEVLMTNNDHLAELVRLLPGITPVEIREVVICKRCGKQHNHTEEVCSGPVAAKKPKKAAEAAEQRPICPQCGKHPQAKDRDVCRYCLATAAMRKHWGHETETLASSSESGDNTSLSDAAVRSGSDVPGDDAGNDDAPALDYSPRIEDLPKAASGKKKPLSIAEERLQTNIKKVVENDRELREKGVFPASWDDGSRSTRAQGMKGRRF